MQFYNNHFLAWWYVGGTLAVASRPNEQLYTLEIVEAHTRDGSMPFAAPGHTPTSPLIGDSTNGVILPFSTIYQSCDEL